MDPFIIVIYQGLSATAEILLYLTVQLQFISVTAGFIFTKRQLSASELDLWQD